MIWEATSPSNLALIKYMGKKTELKKKNIPLNPSLSWTLNHFLTKVSLTKNQEEEDRWCPYKVAPFYFDSQLVYLRDSKKICYRSSQNRELKTSLSTEDQNKFLDFFKFLKQEFFITGSYLINSANNFPLSIGAASSASSFSALTLATYRLAQNHSSRKEFISRLTKKDLSRLSRVGSGSSCRSFFSPWSYWVGEFAQDYSCSFEDLIHQLVVVDSSIKSVSSSGAHKQVLTSPHFKNRVLRAEKRCLHLKQALDSKNWKKIFEISWDEFVDMHQLFETSSTPFKYKQAASDSILNQLKSFWEVRGDGPIVTMDAGANIHLLYRKDQKKTRQEIERMLAKHLILSSDIE